MRFRISAVHMRMIPMIMSPNDPRKSTVVATGINIDPNIDVKPSMLIKMVISLFMLI